MIFSIECGALAKGIAQVRGVVGNGAVSPILANVLLEAGDGLVRIIACDQSIQIQTELPCTVEKAGRTTVLAQRLHDALRNLPAAGEARLSLDEADPRLILKSGRSRFQLPVLPAEDFPLMAPDKKMVTAAFDSDELTRLIDKTRFAIADDKVRLFLNGLFVHTVASGDAKLFRAVSTDGHRLALAEMAAPEDLEFPTGVVIPTKTVLELRKLIDDAGETVEASLSDSKVCFNLGSAVIISKVLGSNFIDYPRMIPVDQPNSLRIETSLLKDALRRAMVISTEKSRSVSLSTEEGKLTLLARDMDTGEVQEIVDADLAGAGVQCRFNAGYLLEAASQVDGEISEFRFEDARNPWLLVDPADKHARFIVMPQFGT